MEEKILIESVLPVLTRFGREYGSGAQLLRRYGKRNAHICGPVLDSPSTEVETALLGEPYVIRVTGPGAGKIESLIDEIRDLTG